MSKPMTVLERHSVAYHGSQAGDCIFCGKAYANESEYCPVRTKQIQDRQRQKAEDAAWTERFLRTHAITPKEKERLRSYFRDH